MDSTCRLCSKHSSSLTSIFSLKGGRLLVDMITTICPIKIELSDDLPQQICSKCLKTTIDAVELREKSVESDINFRTNEIQQPLDTVIIKKEVDPFQPAMIFESEDKQDSDNESSEEAYDCLVSYEPKVKRNKLELHCEKCGRVYTTQSHLTIHMREAHNDPEYCNSGRMRAKCHICGMDFTQRQNLPRHIQRYHDPNLPFPCKKCPMRYQTEVRLKTHEIKEHLDSSHETVFETNVNDHFGSSVKSEAFSCNECDATFIDEKSLVNHFRRDHKDISGSFVCELCDAIFTKRQNLSRHYTRFHLSELQHECNVCLKKFFNAELLYRHQTRVHEKDNGFPPPPPKQAGELVDDTCKYCDQTFNGSKYRLERHLVTMHESELERTFQCDICSKKFIYYASLKIHLDVHRKKKREEELPFKCPKCSRSFVDGEKLKSHLDTRHNPNLYVCHICGKSFHGSSGNHYEAHMKRHNNIRNYQCQQCSLTFVTPRELERHLTTHSDARPFVCTHEGCGMRFKTNDICKRHIKRHAVGFVRKRRYFLKVSSDLL